MLLPFASRGVYSPTQSETNGMWVRATQTRQFRVRDVVFFKHGNLVDKLLPLDQLITSDSATLNISNQKNGQIEQTIHHESCDSPHSPVKALARRVYHILNNGGTTDFLICEYMENEPLHTVTPTNMIQLIRKVAMALKLHKAGIDIDLIGNHSLRVGGAMYLKLLANQTPW